MQLGPNMKRLREMDVAETVKACVTAGPGDLMRYEVSACLDIDGMELEVIGRGTDHEMAAASAMSVLNDHGAALEPEPDADPLPQAGDGLLWRLNGRSPMSHRWIGRLSIDTTCWER